MNYYLGGPSCIATFKDCILSEMEAISERCRSYFINGVKWGREKSKDYEKANKGKFSVHSQANESPVPMRYQALSAPGVLRHQSIPYTFIRAHVLL
jgi:hypothetical protein